MKETVKIGYVGVGRRGYNMLTLSVGKMKDIEIVAICDLDEEKLERAKNALVELGRPAPICTTDVNEINANPEIDAVMYFTGWNDRLKLAKESMKAGKYTAIEVGCAENMQDIYDIVDIYEKTGVPIMMLENCCYSKREMMALNMMRQGLLGEVFHMAGGYCHNLNAHELLQEICDWGGNEITHYRLGHYINGNCENYPTHELGPIAKCLKINRGNRMLRLSSFASKSVCLKDFAKNNIGEDSEYAKIDYKQGDIVNTIITCANGETILLTLDTTAPRNCYSRQFTVRGTKGMIYEDRKVVWLDGMEEIEGGNEDEAFEKYGHPLSKEAIEYETENTKIEEQFGLHADGVDWMIIRSFIEAVKNGTDTPIDAYDTAVLLSIGLLSAESIQNGGAPVECPDFTNGKWNTERPIVKSKYSLDEVIVDNSIGIYDCAL